MKKLIAAALTGALVLGTVGTSVVFAADDDKTITVAASETPHSEILEAAKPILEEEGYDLEVTVFDDYVQPNEVVESGDFDANYFQHIPYLNSFNEEKGTHLVNAGGIHYEPFGIYPGTKSSLADIADSTHSTLHHLLCSHVFYSTEKEKKYRSDGIPFPVQLSYRSFLSMHGWQKNKAFRNNSSTNSIRCPSQQELTAANLQSSTVVHLQKAFRDCDNDVKSHLLRLANPHVPY